jgi:hypothetical protein
MVFPDCALDEYSLKRIPSFICSGAFLRFLGPSLILDCCNDGIFNKNSERDRFLEDPPNCIVEIFPKTANCQTASQQEQ